MTIFPGVLPSLQHQFISGLDLLLRFVGRVAPASDLAVVGSLRFWAVPMCDYRFAPGLRLGVEYFQILGTSTHSLWFCLCAHFVLDPLALSLSIKAYHRKGCTSLAGACSSTSGILRTRSSRDQSAGFPVLMTSFFFNDSVF